MTFLTSKVEQNADSMHIGARIHGQPRAELEQRLNVTGTERLVSLMNTRSHWDNPMRPGLGVVAEGWW